MTKTLTEWQDEIGDWADVTFDHTPLQITAHLLEKAMKTHNSMLGIRECDPVTDVAGVLVLALTLIDYLEGDADDELTREMNRNRTSTFKVDETGLSHRVAS